MDEMKTGEIIDLREFRDILADRRSTSDLLWASRAWIPNPIYQVVNKSKWKGYENVVLNSYRLWERFEELFRDQEREFKKEILLDEARKILIEIGYRKVEPVLRWLAFITAKILKKLFISIYVNEKAVFQAKSQMGTNPVLILPTHKSYLDFIFMSYLSFHYDLDIPRIAAGMDFHSMKFVSTILRDACTFYMRRTFNSDKLYGAVFSEYVESLVTYEDAPIEFFIEGTRSRTGKSLVPKYGLLTMSLMPFLKGKVPDVTILPVSISYERVLEEVLFVYELLGVPKPKESTKGLFKAFKLLSSSYGHAFLNFGETVSVKEFFGNEIDRSNHNHGPTDFQSPSQKESDEINRLCNAIVRKHQNLTVLTCFNLIATVLNHRVMDFRDPMSLDDLVPEVAWLTEIFKRLGAKVAVESDIATTVSAQLNLHKSFVNVTSDGKVKLMRIHSASGGIDRNDMKGHPISDKAMDIAVPLLLLQYYSNPCAHFLVNLGFIVLTIESACTDVSLDLLKHNFKMLRSIYCFEFVLNTETEKEDFESALEFGTAEKAIVQCGSNIFLGENKKLRTFCISFFRNYILSYLVLIDVLTKVTEREASFKSIQIAYQEAVESRILLGSNIHPASLSLDIVSNAMQAFARSGAVTRKRMESGTTYVINTEVLQELSHYLSTFSAFYKNVEVSEHFTDFLTGKL